MFPITISTILAQKITSLIIKNSYRNRKLKSLSLSLELEKKRKRMTRTLLVTMYAHNFKDKKTKHCWTFPVKDASAETFIEVLLLFFSLMHRHNIKNIVGIIRTDAGSNYTAKIVKTFLEAKGIKT